MQLIATATLGGTTCEDFKFGKVRKGGSEGPWIWNLIAHSIIADVEEAFCWRIRDVGVQIPICGAVDIAAWADNLFWPAANIETGLTMLTEITQILHSWGLEWKHDSLMLTGGYNGRSNHMIVTGQEITTITVHYTTYHLKHNDHMHVLGNSLTTNTTGMVRYRLLQGSRTAWDINDSLTCREVPSREKWKAYMAQPRKSARYGAGGWTWSQRTWSAVHLWENFWIRKLHRVAWEPGEEYGAWVRRHTLAAQEKMMRNQYKTMTEAALEQQLHLLGYALDSWARNWLRVSGRRNGQTWRSGTLSSWTSACGPTWRDKTARPHRQTCRDLRPCL